MMPQCLAMHLTLNKRWGKVGQAGFYHFADETLTGLKYLQSYLN